jgi:glycosyltransferase involved in cell wall biosynthesis
MIINHCISSLDNPSAGPTYSVRSLCLSLAENVESAELFSVGTPKIDRSGNLVEQTFLPDYSAVRFLSRLGASRFLRSALFSSRADIFHIHGLWMLPNCYPAEAARRIGKPLMLSPHGMLGGEALRFSSKKKRLFLALWQARALRQVDCFRATCEAEYEEIRAFGLKQPVAIIPNGIDIPCSPPALARSSVNKVLSLGRIHPKKGLDRLIRAWALVEAEHPNWHLDIVGPSEAGHDQALKRLSGELGLRSVSVSGPVFGDEKLRMLAGAEIFALSTLNENFAMTVAESLACCTLVISTKGAPWAGLEANGCGWWIDHGPEAMAAALREAMALSPSERQAMGARGRAWMERDFGWPGIAEQMLSVYRWMIDGGDVPNSVRVE